MTDNPSTPAPEVPLFLHALSDRLRSIPEPIAALQAALEMVGRHLRLNRVGYCDVEDANGTLFFSAGWGDGVLAPITGRMPLSFLGADLIADYRAGRSNAIADVELDPRCPPGAFAGVDARAGAGVPLIRGGAWVAGLFAHHAEVRVWTGDEVAVLEGTLLRTWEAVERARAEARLLRSEQRQRLLYQLIAMQRRATDVEDLLRTAAAAIGVFLDADRAGFLETPAPDTLAFSGAWSGGRLPPLEGAFPRAGIGTGVLAEVLAGRTLVLEDTRSDSKTADSVFAEIGTIAAVGVPVMRDGRWCAGLYVNQAEPRRWQAEEIALVEEVAEIAWDAVERLRARESLAEASARIRDIDALRVLNAGLERKVTAQALARGRTWQLSPDLVGVLNGDGYFEASNPAWEAVLGWSELELASTPFLDLIHPDDLLATQLAWQAALEHGEPALRFENRYRHKLGAWRWLSWVAVPDDGKVYCSARDVTAEKDRQAELALAQEALRQAQKMEAVGQLTGGLAHDFNNLLAGISGSLEMLQMRLTQGKLGALDRYLTSAQSAARRAAALTHRLLAFSRRQTLVSTSTDANRLIAEMAELIRRTVGPGIEVEVVGAGGLWPILVDPNQLENALLNLCINARDAMPHGGRITIETANKWLDDRAAAERDLSPGQYVSLCVTDTGTGMTPEVISRAFDPFFTTKPTGEGTGLGLSMVYGFVRQSGGQVRIYSELERGTTMCLYLPRGSKDSATEATPASEASADLDGAGKLVLVVDDEPTIRSLIVEVLEDWGYMGIEAGDGPAGLRALQSGAKIDLLITDVGLPGGMNGRQIADAARLLRPGLKVLFITGYAENAAIGNGHLDQGMEVLTKPFSLDDLAKRIQRLLES